MSTAREKLEELIRQPVDSAATASMIARAAEVLRDVIRAEEAAWMVLGIDHGSELGTKNRGPADLAGLTLHDAAERVLKDAGSPLHVRELGKRIKARGWVHPRSTKPRPDQISYQLAARLPRHPDVFRRTGPNTFGLVIWDRTGLGSRPKPSFGLFRGPGNVAKTIGEDPSSIFGDIQWRSS